MVKKWTLQFLLISLIPALAHAQEDQYFPHGALSNAYYQEKAEQAKADEMEREAVRKRDDYENKRRESERQVAGHKYQIEQLKTRQAKAQEELEMLNASLQHVRDQIRGYETQHAQLDKDTQTVLKRLQGERSVMEAEQKKMEATIADLTLARKRSEREIYEKGIDVQRMKTDTARLETKLAAADAKKTALDAEEMKMRTDWMQAKMALAEAQRQNDEANAQLNEARERWNLAQKDLSETKADLSRVQKARDSVVGRVNDEVARYEKEILAANRAKIAGEAEQIRLSSEAEKMKDYAARIRETRDQAAEQETETNGLVLRTKVAVETARSELHRDVESSDRRVLLNEKAESKRRGLASAAEAAALLNGGRVWMTKQKCKAYLTPNSSGQAVGFFESGRKLMGRDSGGNWIEISNGAGKSVFVEGSCGDYKD
ncbi:MAG: hypothetical protein KF799_11390 [Bdellovibrionales bacterium]|nr:hypothetical protein [Bdellovibrionales bacterium]